MREFFLELHERLKWLVAGKEMAKLSRYRVACREAWRWNGQIPGSSETALWIEANGEDLPRLGISEFRNQLLKDKEKA